MDQCSYYSSVSLVRQQHESNNIESAQTQETDMIRPAKANDEPEIRGKRAVNTTCFLSS